jgi:hypothetical protein
VTSSKRAKKQPDPRRTPERLADGFMPALLKERSTGLNLLCESRPEAVALAKELRRRGWKAKPRLALNLQTGKAVDYVDVARPNAFVVGAE